MDAIKHARKYFPTFEEEHLTKIQKVMALLAFSVNTGWFFVGLRNRFCRNGECASIIDNVIVTTYIVDELMTAEVSFDASHHLYVV